MAKKILIIEDEQGLAEEWQIGLRYEGYDTQIVTSVDEVHALLDHLDFDLVILDILLPTINESKALLRQTKYGRTAGVWCAKQIKKRKPGLPILVVTVVTDIQILSDLLEAGADRVLNKPCNVQDLLTNIKLLYNECVRKEFQE